MIKALQLKKDERLYEWIDRIVKYYETRNIDSKTLRDILHDVSVHSYVHGTRDAQEVLSRINNQ